VGSDLGSCGLVGLGRVAIAHSISGPERSHTSGSLALAPGSPARAPHLTETAARPLAPHPRHLTRDLRSSTLAYRLSPSRNGKFGVSSVPRCCGWVVVLRIASREAGMRQNVARGTG
jgi:hypothetical protein